MAIAGYDPNAAIPFWERMSQQGSGGNIELLSTHPSDSNRITEIQKELPEAMEYYNAIWGKGNTTAPANNNSSTNSNWHF